MAQLYRGAALPALALLCLPAPAAASDDAFEFWLNPSVSIAMDDDTGLKFETAQRLRDADDGRANTYFARLWLNQDLSERVTLSGGVEHRINSPGSDETRFLQQVSTKHGIWRTRFRLEQRLVDNARMGLRFRPRIGVEVPLGERSRWSFVSDAEGMLTLRSTSRGGDDGFTGLRTQIGAAYEASDRLTLSLTYLRAQTFEDGGPDEVGHAPLVGIELSL